MHHFCSPWERLILSIHLVLPGATEAVTAPALDATQTTHTPSFSLQTKIHRTKKTKILTHAENTSN